MTFSGPGKGAARIVIGKRNDNSPNAIEQNTPRVSKAPLLPGAAALAFCPWGAPKMNAQVARFNRTIQEEFGLS